MASASEVAIVGSLNLDIVVQLVNRPRPGETVFGDSLETFLGGKGANQAVAAAQLRTTASMIGQVGTDDFGSQILSGVAGRGVNVQHVGRVSGPSGVAIITIDDEAQNEIIVISGANSHLDRDFVDLNSRSIETASVVLAQLEIPMESVVRSAKIAHSKRIPFILDPAPARPLPDELYSLVTWLTPNEAESYSLLCEGSEKDPPYIAHKLLARGVRNVVLKLGAAGVYIAGEDVQETLIEGFKVAAVDSTAAGDAFNGAFAASLAHQVDPISAARIGCAVGALCVMRRGAQSSLPTFEELSSFLEIQDPALLFTLLKHFPSNSVLR